MKVASNCESFEKLIKPDGDVPHGVAGIEDGK
jgi:hypothetical protein